MAIIRALVLTTICWVFSVGHLSAQGPEWSVIAGLGVVGLDHGISPSAALGAEASWDELLITAALTVAAPPGTGRYRWEEIPFFDGTWCADTESEHGLGVDDSLCPARSWGLMVDAVTVLPLEDSFSFLFGGGLRAESGVTPYVLLGVEIGIEESIPVFIRTTAGLNFWQAHVGVVCCRMPILDSW